MKLMTSNENPTAGSVDCLGVKSRQKLEKISPIRYRICISFLICIGVIAFSGCTHTKSVQTEVIPGDHSEVTEISETTETIVFLPVDPSIHAPVIAEPPPLGAATVKSGTSDLKSTIYIPSEDTSGSQGGNVGDLRSKIYVPSEQSTEPEAPDLRSRIFVPSEQPVDTNDLRSKIYVPSEAE